MSTIREVWRADGFRFGAVDVSNVLDEYADYVKGCFTCSATWEMNQDDLCYVKMQVFKSLLIRAFFEEN